MPTSDFKTSIIALACWRAASQELHPVMLCVCMVFRNRAAAGGDLYENAAHWLDENPGAHPDPRDPQFQQLLSKIDGVISGLVADKTNGALYFVPKPLLPERMDDLAITTTIGQMVFLA